MEFQVVGLFPRLPDISCLFPKYFSLLNICFHTIVKSFKSPCLISTETEAVRLRGFDPSQL